jgi:hypothetical protein
VSASGETRVLSFPPLARLEVIEATPGDAAALQA